jgi:hypothetical protein
MTWRVSFKSWGTIVSLPLTPTLTQNFKTFLANFSPLYFFAIQSEHFEKLDFSIDFYYDQGVARLLP